MAPQVSLLLLCIGNMYLKLIVEDYVFVPLEVWEDSLMKTGRKETGRKGRKHYIINRKHPDSSLGGRRGCGEVTSLHPSQCPGDPVHLEPGSPSACIPQLRLASPGPTASRTPDPGGAQARHAEAETDHDDLQHFALADGPVAVHVVEGEGPLELLVGLARRGHVQGDDVLLEVQGAVTVGVEAPEHMLGVGLGVGLGEELGVDLLELLPRDAAAGALLQEGLVPGAQLLLCELGVQLQLLQDLLGQGPTLAVPHG